MVERAEVVRQGELTFAVAAVEDILLFKAITDREGDVDDSIAIIRNHPVDWQAVLTEAAAQASGGSEIWFTWMTASFERIDDLGDRIPILPALARLSDSHLAHEEKRLGLDRDRRSAPITLI